MPYIIMRRTDIPDGVLQVIDLKPNTSQRNYIYDPGEGQSGYVRNISENQTVATSGAGPIVTVSDYCGLAAYLIDNVEDSSTTAITDAVANAAAVAIIAIARAGTALGLAQVNAALVTAGATAGTGLATGNSTGSLAELMQILQGSKYMLPGGSQVETAGNLFVTTRSGSFEFEVRRYYLTGAFNISNGEGNLHDMKQAGFEYKGVLGPAISVYADDGSVL
jgi:hypothetical protein